jgi:hypothetical protein
MAARAGKKYKAKCAAPAKETKRSFTGNIDMSTLFIQI